MRPAKLVDYIGQEHLVGKNAILQRIIETGKLPSFILWGPPGVGKTTLAYAAAKKIKKPVYIFQCTMDTRPEDLPVWIQIVFSTSGRL